MVLRSISGGYDVPKIERGCYIHFFFYRVAIVFERKETHMILFCRALPHAKRRTCCTFLMENNSVLGLTEARARTLMFMELSL